MGDTKGFFMRWGRELIVLLLAALGGLIGSSTAIFAAAYFGGGWGLLVLTVGRVFNFLLNASTLTSVPALIEIVALFAEGVVGVLLFSFLYKRTQKFFLAGLPWLVILGVGHGLFKALVLDLPVKHVVFAADKAIVLSLISVVVAFCDVFLAYMAHLFLDDRMNKISRAALARGKGDAAGEDQSGRWM